jgi:hypothetical protein
VSNFSKHRRRHTSLRNILHVALVLVPNFFPPFFLTPFTYIAYTTFLFTPSGWLRLIIPTPTNLIISYENTIFICAFLIYAHFVRNTTRAKTGTRRTRKNRTLSQKNVITNYCAYWPYVLYNNMKSCMRLKSEGETSFTLANLTAADSAPCT